MNTRFHSFELVVTASQVVDAAKAVFHTILLHRTTGKYNYNLRNPGTFSVGSMGIEDTDCTSMDFTYVKASGEDMDHWLSGEVHGFASSLCQQGLDTRIGKILLEFYEKKKGRWLLPAETSSWEAWQLTLHVVEPNNDTGK
jgi:autophagy-related protein 101